MKLTRKYLLLQDLEANAIYSLMNRFDNTHCHLGAGSPLLPPFCGGSLSAYRDSTNIHQMHDYHQVSTLVDDLLAICPPVTIAASTATMTMESKEKLRQVMVVSPPTTPDRPAASTSGRYYSSSLPTSLDPADESFAAILHVEADIVRINPVHVAVRRDVLVVHRTKSGKVFFQCRCCRHLPLSQRAKLSVVSPQCVNNLYRSFVRFMMVHAQGCEHLPAHVRALVKGGGKGGFVKARSGIKKYWASSALEMGLVDGEDGMSIEYRPPLPDCNDVNVAAVAVTDR